MQKHDPPPTHTPQMPSGANDPVDYNSGSAPSDADRWTDLRVQPLTGEAAARVLLRAVPGEEVHSLAPDLPKVHLLVVDEDLPVLRACCQVGAQMSFSVHAASSANQARDYLQRAPVDVVLLDLRVTAGGMDLLQQILAERPRLSVIVMTAFATVSSTVEAMRIGASDYLTKPFALEELTSVLERAGQRRQFDLESRRLEEKLRTGGGTVPLIGASAQIERMFRIVAKVALSNHPVLILGESGTGKEVVARAIHAHGAHSAAPFMPLDCGALSPSAIETELFGYARGAFTGADRSHEGLLASQAGGTVLLDEVSELPLDLQAKLLRALQEREVRPVGSAQRQPITVRVLAATHRDLPSLVEQGLFRKDLFYRLNVVTLRIPPLRERPGDIALLTEHFIARMRRQMGIPFTLADDALKTLSEYAWPGNVRELENAIERACALSSGPVLHRADLPTQLSHMAAPEDEGSIRIDARMPQPTLGPDQAWPLLSIAELERRAILNTLRQLKGDKAMAARLLGIGKTTLYRKLKEYGIADD